MGPEAGLGGGGKRLDVVDHSPHLERARRLIDLGGDPGDAAGILLVGAVGAEAHRLADRHLAGILFVDFQGEDHPRDIRHLEDRLGRLDHLADDRITADDDPVKRGGEGEEIRRHDVVIELGEQALRKADGADPLGPSLVDERLVIGDRHGEPEVHQRLFVVDKVDPGFAERRAGLAELPAHDGPLHLLEDRHLLAPRFERHQGIEKLGLQPPHLLAVDDEEHLPLTDDVAKMLLDAPDAPADAGRELGGAALVVVDDTSDLELTHHRPPLHRHDLDPGSLERLARGKPDRPRRGIIGPVDRRPISAAAGVLSMRRGMAGQAKRPMRGVAEPPHGHQRRGREERNAPRRDQGKDGRHRNTTGLSGLRP